MTNDTFLANICRDFLKQHKVFRYRTNKIADMNDREVISACHHYCNEHRITDEFEQFRNRVESEYRYCSLIQEYIEDGMCIDIQMLAFGLIGEDALPVLSIDRLKAQSCCDSCMHANHRMIESSRDL
jgi:hypothetical protein